MGAYSSTSLAATDTIAQQHHQMKHERRGGLSSALVAQGEAMMALAGVLVGSSGPSRLQPNPPLRKGAWVEAVITVVNKNRAHHIEVFLHSADFKPRFADQLRKVSPSRERLCGNKRVCRGAGAGMWGALSIVESRCGCVCSRVRRL